MPLARLVSGLLVRMSFIIAAFIDVAQARSDYERAQNELINAVYQFHRDFASLELAVGRPLR